MKSLRRLILGTEVVVDLVLAGLLFQEVWTKGWDQRAVWLAIAFAAAFWPAPVARTCSRVRAARAARTRTPYPMTEHPEVFPSAAQAAAKRLWAPR